LGDDIINYERSYKTVLKFMVLTDKWCFHRSSSFCQTWTLQCILLILISTDIILPPWRYITYVSRVH